MSNFLTADADERHYGEVELDDDGNCYIEMRFRDETAKLISGPPVPEGSCMCMRVYLASVKKPVINRDTDLLNPEGNATHTTLKFMLPYTKSSRYGMNMTASADDHARERTTALT